MRFGLLILSDKSYRGFLRCCGSNYLPVLDDVISFHNYPFLKIAERRRTAKIRRTAQNGDRVGQNHSIDIPHIDNVISNGHGSPLLIDRLYIDNSYIDIPSCSHIGRGHPLPVVRLAAGLPLLACHHRRICCHHMRTGFRPFRLSKALSRYHGKA